MFSSGEQLMKISEANLDDIRELCLLLNYLFEQEAEFCPDFEKQSAGLKMIIENPHIGVILTARDDEGICGMVNILYSVSTALGKKSATIEDMIVAPNRRSSRIGSKLLNAAIEKCRSEDCGRITLLTDNDNFDAQKFYQKNGFSISPMIPMRLKL